MWWGWSRALCVRLSPTKRPLQPPSAHCQTSSGHRSLMWEHLPPLTAPASVIKIEKLGCAVKDLLMISQPVVPVCVKKCQPGWLGETAPQPAAGRSAIRPHRIPLLWDGTQQKCKEVTACGCSCVAGLLRELFQNYSVEKSSILYTWFLDVTLPAERQGHGSGDSAWAALRPGVTPRGLPMRPQVTALQAFLQERLSAGASGALSRRAASFWACPPLCGSCWPWWHPAQESPGPVLSSLLRARRTWRRGGW